MLGSLTTEKKTLKQKLFLDCCKTVEIKKKTINHFLNVQLKIWLKIFMNLNLNNFHDQIEGDGPPLVQLGKVVLEQFTDLLGVVRLHLLLLRPRRQQRVPVQAWKMWSHF